MQTSTHRIKKYDKKIRGLILPWQKENFTAKTDMQVQIERIVDDIVGSNIYRVYYMIFGKEVYKMIHIHTQGTLDTEIDILRDKWSSRGMDLDVMTDIENALGYQTGPAGPQNFTLDSSLLDGPDILV